VAGDGRRGKVGAGGGRQGQTGAGSLMRSIFRALIMCLKDYTLTVTFRNFVKAPKNETKNSRY